MDDDREPSCDEAVGVSTLVLLDEERLKKEKRFAVGVGAMGVAGVVLTLPGVEKLFSMGGSGEAGDGGFSIPISFMVAFKRSRSRRSSSSSVVSSLRAPVTTGGSSLQRKWAQVGRRRVRLLVSSKHREIRPIERERPSGRARR